MLPDGLNWLCYFAGSSKSHRENSIFFIFLESPHQVDMKNVVKCYKDFFGYFNALKTNCEKPAQLNKHADCRDDGRSKNLVGWSSNRSIFDGTGFESTSAKMREGQLSPLPLWVRRP